MTDKYDRYRNRYIPNTQIVDNGFLYRGARLYNEIPDSFRTLIREKLQQTIKMYISERELCDSKD